MSVKINYKSASTKQKNSNLVLFVDEKLNISGLKKHISSSEFSYISPQIGAEDWSGYLREVKTKTILRN